jgi:hypothetical protein
VSNYILENGERKDIRPDQETLLVSHGVIYWSDDGYYHLGEGQTWQAVELLLLPDFLITIQGRRHYSGKTLLMSILNRALAEAGFSNVVVVHGDTPEYFERMTAGHLENVRNNSPEYFTRKIELIEAGARLRPESSAEKTPPRMTRRER